MNYPPEVPRLALVFGIILTIWFGPVIAASVVVGVPNWAAFVWGIIGFPLGLVIAIEVNSAF